MTRYVIGIAVVLLLIAAFHAYRKQHAGLPPFSPVKKAQNTVEAFKGIQPGMSCRQVADLLGSEGKKTPEHDYKTYYWGNDYVIFRGDISQAVHGSPMVKGVKTNMTYRQVAAKMKSNGRLDKTESCYTWTFNNRRILVFFVDDQVSRPAL